MKYLILFLCALGTLQCGASSPAPAPLEASTRSRATALLDAGHFLEASYYLEASIHTPADERELLPILVEAQLRSDLLYSALHSMRRLNEVSPGNTALPALFEQVAQAVGSALTLEKTGEPI